MDSGSAALSQPGLNADRPLRHFPPRLLCAHPGRSVAPSEFRKADMTSRASERRFGGKPFMD
jgi:hypothetical protein